MRFCYFPFTLLYLIVAYHKRRLLEQLRLLPLNLLDGFKSLTLTFSVVCTSLTFTVGTTVTSTAETLAVQFEAAGLLAVTETNVWP